MIKLNSSFASITLSLWICDWCWYNITIILQPKDVSNSLKRKLYTLHIIDEIPKNEPFLWHVAWIPAHVSMKCVFQLLFFYKRIYNFLFIYFALAVVNPTISLSYCWAIELYNPVFIPYIFPLSCCYTNEIVPMISFSTLYKWWPSQATVF